MKNIIAIFTILLSLSSFAQEVKFTPKWKKGDKRKISMLTEEKKWKKGKLVKDEQTPMEALLTVKNVTKEHFEIHLKYENFALTTYDKVYDMTGESAKEFAELNLVYHVSKDGKQYDLINWKEAKAVITGNSEDFKNKMESNTDKKDTNSVFSSLAKLGSSRFDNKEAVETMFDEEIEALLVAFQSSYSKDTVTVVEMAKNPFKSGGKPGKADSLEAVTKYWFGKKSGSLYELNQKEIIDATEYKEMMKEVMKKMTIGFMMLMEKDTTNDKFRTRISELDEKLNSINFDIDLLVTANFNSKTSFPTKVVKEGEITTSKMKGEDKKWSRITLTFE